MKTILLSIFALVVVGVFGTFAQTNMHTDINLLGNSNIASPIVFNGKLFFSADDGASGSELWSLDANNVLSNVADINPGGSSGSWGMTEFNGKLYFTANDGVNGYELWEYDGVNAPVLSYDLYTGVTNGYPGAFVSFNNKLFFSGVDGSQLGSLYGIYEFDGINSPTTISSEISLSGAWYAHELNGSLYYLAYDGGSSTRIYSYDGVSAPVLVDSVLRYNTNTQVHEFNGSLFMGLDDAQIGTQLCKINNVNDTEILTSFSNQGGVNPLLVFNNELIFSKYDQMGAYDLYKYDGTSVTSLGFQNNQSWQAAIVYGNKMYFGHDDGVNGIELWMYDGSNPPSMIQDINTSGDSNPARFVKFNNRLYFAADDGIHGRELWVFDEINGIGKVDVSISIEIFPNPSNATITIQSDVIFDRLEIKDLSGQHILTSKNQTIDVSNFENGVYLITVYTENGSSTKRFVKE